jgi:hypothetical protein
MREYEVISYYTVADVSYVTADNEAQAIEKAQSGEYVIKSFDSPEDQGYEVTLREDKR